MLHLSIDPELEARAMAVLERSGMTNETAVQALFRYLAEKGSLPAALRPPNPETVAALIEADDMIAVRRRAALGG